MRVNDNTEPDQIHCETIGRATLYHADCRKILPMLSPDVIVTDPPYGTGTAPKGGRQAGTIDLESKVVLEWDEYSEDWMALCKQIPMAVFCGQATIIRTAGAMKAEGALMYVKTNPSPFGTSWEPCLVRGWKRPTQWQHWLGYNAENCQVHPTQKPLRLMEWILSTAPIGVVCDPFMGSGTTGVAAMNLERRFIGVERERKYFDIACERIEAAYAQGSLLDLTQPVLEQQDMVF